MTSPNYKVRPDTQSSRLNYSKKKYGYILDAGDTSPLMGLSDRNKHRAMCAIANLAKFQNRYEAWNSNR